MSTIVVPVLEFAKTMFRRRKVVVKSNTVLYVGSFLTSRNDIGYVVVETGSTMEIIQLDLSGAAWFRPFDEQICLDTTLPFPSTQLVPGDLLVFEFPKDGWIERWGFLANYWDLQKFQIGDRGDLDMIDRIPELLPTFLLESHFRFADWDELLEKFS